MKILYIPILLLLLPILLYGQSYPRDIPTLDAEGLKGPVKAMYKKVMRAHQEGDSVVERTEDSQHDLHYNERGQLTKRVQYLVRKPWETEEYYYDSMGNLIESLESNPRLKLYIRWTYTYDHDGYLLKKVGIEAEGTDVKQWGGPGTPFGYWECLRDSSGRVTKEWFSSSKKGYKSYQYENDGKTRSVFVVDSSGVSFLREFRKEISEDSVLIIERWLNRDADTVINQTLVVYPGEFNIVQYRDWRGDERNEEDRWEVDQIDQYGNWVKRSHYSCYEWKGEWRRQIMHVGYRRIEYYDEGEQGNPEGRESESPQLNLLMNEDGVER